jgi:hypothetical protein
MSDKETSGEDVGDKLPEYVWVWWTLVNSCNTPEEPEEYEWIIKRTSTNPDHDWRGKTVSEHYDKMARYRLDTGEGPPTNRESLEPVVGDFNEIAKEGKA